MAEISRREWLKLSQAALVGGALLNSGCKPPASNTSNTAGEGVFELESKILDKNLGGTNVRLRSFNGTVPGPMLKTRPGETLRVRVKNSLPPYDSAGWNGDHNVPHALDTTNLHVHGMDVAPHLFEPLGTSDPLAPMIHIHPGATFDYAFELPKNHPPGLYWYHPHHHGSTAVQAVSGMAGGLIVYGDIDEVPEIKAARDIPLVMQDIGLFPSEDVPGLWEYNPRQNAIWQTFPIKDHPNQHVTMYNPKDPANPIVTDLKGGFTTGDYALRYFMLNGEPFYKETHNPATPTSPTGQQLPPARIQMAQGEIVRFRMLNACSDNLMPIIVQGHDLHLIALDGVNFPAVRTMPAPATGTDTGQIQLAPANRAEFLIQAVSTPGVYQIIQLEQSQQFLHSSQKVIAEIEVTTEVKKMALPTTLPTQSRYYPLIDPLDVKVNRTFVFGGAFPGIANPVVGIDFLINNTQYQEQAVPQIMQVGSVEEWELQVFGSHHGGTEGHPFHIHVNHFEVISIDGKPPMSQGTTIQDTIWIPMKSTVVVRSKIKEFKGKAVYHCHILPHEDTGMMQNFLIL